MSSLNDPPSDEFDMVVVNAGPADPCSPEQIPHVASNSMSFDMASHGQSNLAEQPGSAFNNQGAEGAKADFGIDHSLTRDDFTLRVMGLLRIEHAARPPRKT